MINCMDNLTDKQKKDIETISDLFKAANILEGNFFIKRNPDSTLTDNVYQLYSVHNTLCYTMGISYHGMPFFRTIENLGRAIEMVGKERIFELFRCDTLETKLAKYVYE